MSLLNYNNANNKCFSINTNAINIIILINHEDFIIT